MSSHCLQSSLWVLCFTPGLFWEYINYANGDLPCVLANQRDVYKRKITSELQSHIRDVSTHFAWHNNPRRIAITHRIIMLHNRSNNNAQSTGESCLPRRINVNINNPPRTSRDDKQRQSRHLFVLRINIQQSCKIPVIKNVSFEKTN